MEKWCGAAGRGIWSLAASRRFSEWQTCIARHVWLATSKRESGSKLPQATMSARRHCEISTVVDGQQRANSRDAGTGGVARLRRGPAMLDPGLVETSDFTRLPARCGNRADLGRRSPAPLRRKYRAGGSDVWEEEHRRECLCHRDYLPSVQEISLTAFGMTGFYFAAFLQRDSSCFDSDRSEGAFNTLILRAWSAALRCSG